MRGRKEKIFCEICECNVNVSRPHNNYQCVSCDVWVHKSCAHQEELLAPNGSYYCFEHKHRAPKKSTRRDNQITRIRVENPTVEELITSVAERFHEELNKSLKNASNANLNLPSLSNDQNLNLPNTSNNMNGFVNAATRMPNHPRANLGLFPKCDRCLKCIIDDNKFFQCVKCNKKSHNNCVMNMERMQSIDGVWACLNCVSTRSQKFMAFRSTDLDTGNEASAIRGKIIPEMSANDSVFMRNDELSRILYNKNLNFSDIVNQSIKVPFQRPDNGNSNYHAAQAASAYRSQSNIPLNNQRNNNDDLYKEKDVAETLKKLNEEIEKLKLQLGTKNNASSSFEKIPKNFNNEKNMDINHGRTQSTPINSEANENSQPLNNDPQIDINASIQMAVEESIRKLNHESVMQMSTMNRRMLEIQMNESMRNTYRILPKVKNPDYEWVVFYQAFNDSRHLFSDCENVARLQKAIECDRIKRSGGHNLFNPCTYISTLEELNKRIGRSENLLINEKLRLMNNLKIRTDDKKGLINLIESIKKYSILVENLGSYAEKTDLSVISRLSRLLPGGIKAKWSLEFNKLREIYNVVHIKQMSSWLDNHIDSCETELYFDKIDPFGEIKTKSLNHESKDSKKKAKHERTFINVTESTSDSESEDDSDDENDMHELVNTTQSSNKNDKVKSKRPGVYCWYHKKDNHSVLYCYSLLNKTGKEVCQLAQKEGYCTKCAGKEHSNCAYNFHCIMPGCDLKHASIFCTMRKPASSSSKIAENARSTDKKIDSTENKESHKSHTIRNEETDENDSMQHERNTNMFNALFADNIPSKNLNYESHMIIENKCKNSFNMTNAETNVDKVLETHTFNSLLPVVVIVLKNGAKSLIGAFLLDTGSSVSIIDEKFSSILNSEGVNKPLCIEWSGGKLRGDNASKIVEYEAQGIHKDAKLIRIYFRTMKNLAMPKQVFNLDHLKKNYKELEKFELQSYSQIAGIIGQDQKHLLKQLKWFDFNCDGKESPTVILTPLGYALMGNSCPINKLYEHLCSLQVSHIHQQNKNYISEGDEEELMRMEESVMSLEYLMPYENDRELVEDKIATQMLNSKVKRMENEKRYEAALLWKELNVEMPTEASYRTAVKRLKIMINHLQRIGKYNEIEKQIENLINKNYAKILNKNDIMNPPRKAFYIPIFITEPKGKRIRLIWDAACKIEGKCLNDYLYSGPNLYVNILSILCTSREGIFFVKGDVAEMFHQVRIVKDDQPSMRFLFMNVRENKIMHLEMNVLIFGAVCAPTIAQFVKNKVASDYQEISPEAAKALTKKMYVDDFVISFNNLEMGKKMIRDARKILQEASFELVKLQANDTRVLDYVRLSMTKESKIHEKLFSNEDQEKILGYSFNFRKDVISLSVNHEKYEVGIIDGNKIPNKKEILRFMMQIYDPLGFFIFFTKNLKLIYHWLCKDKLDWNEVISTKQFSYWKKCLEIFKDVVKIEIPRAYSKNITSAKVRQLIICGDAGKEALCTVAYLRLLDKNKSQLDVVFIAAKSYIVPLRQKRTIPELEMDVAAKAVEFKKSLVKFHEIIFDEFLFFTDNACVFSWIKNRPQKPTIYVNNRYNKIITGSEINQWHWLPTELQPADFGTKFDSLPKLVYENEWFKPKIFSLAEEKWLFLIPSNEQVNTHIEKKPLNNINYSSPIDINRFSSWTKAVRFTQVLLKFKYYLRYVQKLKNVIKTNNKKLALEAKERMCKLLNKMKSREFLYYESELALIKEAQKESLYEERELLEKERKLKTQHKLSRFNPFLDQNKVMRVESRLPKNVHYNEDKRNPIILPKNHRVTRLLILFYHEKNKHIHYKSVIVDLLQRFFISNVSWAVKKIIREECYRCKRINAKPDQPKMGDLPGERLAMFTPPFSYIIIDVCGPFTIKIERKTAKRWLFVVVCLTTRSAHIEILHSMDSQSCLMALQNTINLRGAPSRIISDNGSNFIGGSKILKDMQNKWNEKLLQEGIIQNPIEWDFNPAKASHMNGSVERIIGLIKNTLKNMRDTLDKRMIFPNDEVFRCLVCEVIGLLNNRPLVMLPIEDSQSDFLTPNDFLMMRNNFQSSPKGAEIKINNTISEWIEVKEFIRRLWEHFCKVYLSEIRYREKWRACKKSLCVGDLVVLSDPTIVNLWRMGRIVEINEGSVNQVRKVTVMLGKRVIVSKDKILSKKWKKEYINEKHTVITRPTSLVAAINIHV